MTNTPLCIDTYAHRGYVIRMRPFHPDVWVEKGGHTIVHSAPTVQAARDIIDDLLGVPPVPERCTCYPRDLAHGFGHGDFCPLWTPQTLAGDGIYFGQADR